MKKTAVLWVIIVILLLSNAFFAYEYLKKDNSVPNYPISESSGENKNNDNEKTSGDIFSTVVKNSGESIINEEPTLDNKDKNKEVTAKYDVIVFDAEPEGICAAISAARNNKKVLLDTPNGKEALLKYNTVKKINNFSLVDITLLTGRYHQIRLQFSSRNHPLYGDYLYGAKNEKELALIAYSLSFKHPTTQEQLRFEIDIKNTNFNKILINC